MATVPDLSGNNPFGTDKATRGHYDLPIENYKGTQHSVTAGAVSVQSAEFKNTCRSIRICPADDIYYEVGVNPTADSNSPRLSSEAVEFVPAHGGEKIAVLQIVGGGNVNVVEDR